MSYGAKGVPARFVSVGPTIAAKASSEGWCLCLRPNKATFALNAPAIWSVGAAIWSGLLLGEDRASGEPEICSLLRGASGETEILRGRLPLSEARLRRGVIESLDWTDP
jgi:hypothetical protein